MTTSTIKQGQTFLFKGQYAEVVENQPNSQYITIRVGNNVISVNKNDLFGINSNLLSYYDEQIAMYDEQMNKNKETIDINKSLWTACKEAIKDGKEMMASILDNLGVQYFSQITDKVQKQRYQDLVDKNSTARTQQLRAVTNILQAAISTGSAASSKINAINQKYLAENMLA